MNARWRLLAARTAALILVVLLSSEHLCAYSVLTHEQIVDIVWASEIQPLLLQRFPNLN